MKYTTQREWTLLKKRMRFIQVVIVLELIFALVLLLYISGVLSPKDRIENNSPLLLGAVFTFLQPKTQLGIVLSLKDEVRLLENSPTNELEKGIMHLQQLNKEGMSQLQTYLLVSPILILLELGFSGTTIFVPSILFGVVSYLIFEIWQRNCLKSIRIT